MFGIDSSNSIEPVRGVAAVAVTADGRAATRGFVEPPIREATAGELASAARRALGTSRPEPSPVQAVPDARRSLFRHSSADPVQPDAVAQKHDLYVVRRGNTERYYAGSEQRHSVRWKQEVMRADSKRIATKLDDKQTITAMLDLAQSRGWDTVRLKGTTDFQREAWVQAQVRGMTTEGYKPTSTDQQEAARRNVAMASVRASPMQAAPLVKTAESTVPASTTSKEAAKVISGVTAAAVATGKADALAKVVGSRQPRQSAASKQTAAAAPARTASPTATSSTTSTAPSGVTITDKAKVNAQRSKSVWGAVEATGQQARATDAVTAKAAASDGPRQ